MILVTLGTHPQPMDRLIVALDGLLASGAVDDEIIITGPICGRQPSLARALGIQPYDVLVGWARTATAIVTHGGPASIGHSPVIVPRDPAFGEHVDDHQIRFANWLAERRNVTVVRDMGKLEEALRGTLSRQANTPLSPPIPVEAIAHLRSIIVGGR